MNGKLNIAFFGSSIVSAYWNGAATYYRGIVRALHNLGHNVTFYEPDIYNRQNNKDIELPDYCTVSHKITFKHMQVYDLVNIEEVFDLVWFMGVFYHLRYPVLAMDIVSQKAKYMMVFQTLSVPGYEKINIPEDIDFHDREIMKNPAFPYMAFIEKRFAGDLTNWWIPNHQCILSLLKNCGFRLCEIPEDETYVVFKDNTIIPDFDSWNNSEFLSATARKWQEEIDVKIKKV